MTTMHASLLLCTACNGDPLMAPPCPICGGTGIDMRPVDEAARLAAETIAAQQAEIRRLESALHNCEHELAKAQAKLAELAGPPTWKHMDRIQRPETYR